jgi:hypothetical protein
MRKHRQIFLLTAAFSLMSLIGLALFDAPLSPSGHEQPCVPFHGQCVTPETLVSHAVPIHDYWAIFFALRH